jgi:membrane-bound ClpP family serine protease
VIGDIMNDNAKITLAFGFASIVISFFIFLFYGNVASGIVILVLGIILIVTGGKLRSSSKATIQSGTIN